jgi:threonine aldolase
VQSPQTNMIFVDVAAPVAEPFAAHLRDSGIAITGTARQRWVTHLDVSQADVDAAAAAVDRFFVR